MVRLGQRLDITVQACRVLCEIQEKQDCTSRLSCIGLTHYGEACKRYSLKFRQNYIM